MQHYRWNEDQLLEKYIDSPHSVLREVGEPQNVQKPVEPSRPPSKRARLDTPTEAMCVVCCDTPPIEDFFRTRCMHAFCKSCWTHYVTSKIKDEGQCLFKCMQDGCLTYVDETAIRKLVSPACYERFVLAVLCASMF